MSVHPTSQGNSLAGEYEVIIPAFPLGGGWVGGGGQGVGVSNDWCITLSTLSVVFPLLKEGDQMIQ